MYGRSRRMMRDRGRRGPTAAGRGDAQEADACPLSPMMNLADFTPREVTLEGAHQTRHVAGAGPAVIVMAEMPGISPHLARFARWVQDAGCTVYMPSLFGRDGAVPGAEEGAEVFRRACVSAEFRALRRRPVQPGDRLAAGAGAARSRRVRRSRHWGHRDVLYRELRAHHDARAVHARPGLVPACSPLDDPAGLEISPASSPPSRTGSTAMT